MNNTVAGLKRAMLEQKSFQSRGLNGMVKATGYVVSTASGKKLLVYSNLTRRWYSARPRDLSSGLMHWVHVLRPSHDIEQLLPATLDQIAAGDISELARMRILGDQYERS